VRRKGRGFEPNESDHRKVAAVVDLFGRQFMKHLPTVCRELHRVKADLPVSWREEENMTWEEIAEAVTGDGSAAARQEVTDSYRNAEYFARNVRAIEVLIDRDIVLRGKAGEQPWKFYDLGHGYCSYDFFDQCPHRMACAKCSFYIPKNNTRALLLEGKANLSRMRQEIPLREAELAAVEDGVSALERLLTQLADVPTPAGPTPRQLNGGELVQIRGAGHQGREG
jgi:hypothetical protein